MNLFDLMAVIRLDSSEYEQGLKQAEGLAGGFGSKLQTAVKVGGIALTAATTATVAFGKSAVSAGADFDSSMSQVAATMGTTVDQIQDLRDFAQEMGSTTVFSATEAADALNYMALAGYDSATSMEMLPNVLNLAAAGGFELSRASDMITDASSALGLSLEETSAMVDQMAKASSKSNTSVEQLGDALLALGGTGKNVAGGTTELSTALGIMADSGIKGSEAGTHLRNILLSLTPKSEDAAKAMEALGLQAYDADGNLRPLDETFTELSAALEDYTAEEKTSLLSNIFNKTDLAAVDSLLSAAKYDMDGLTDSLANSGINWGKYGEKLGKAQGSMNDVADSIQAWIAYGTEEEHILGRLQEIYGLTEEDAKTALDSVSGAISEQGNRWTELSGYIDDAQGAAQAMADTQLDNLQGDITLFKSALEGAQIAISDGITPVLRDFVQFGADGLSKLTAGFKEGGLGGAIDAFGEIVSEGLGMLLDSLPEMVEAGGKVLGAVVSGIIDNIPKVIEAAVELIDTFATDISDSLPDLIPALIETVATIVSTLIDNAPKLIESALEIILALANGIVDNIPTLLEYLPQVITSVVSALIKMAPQLIKAAAQLILSLAKGLIQFIPTLLKSIPQIIKAIVNGLLEGTKDIRDVGKQLLEGLWNGINDKVTWLKGKVAGVVDKIKGWFTGSSGFDEHSPSRWAADVFEKLLEGGAEGLDDGESGLLRSVEGVVGSVKDAFAPSASMAFAGGYGGYSGGGYEGPREIVINLVDEIDGAVFARKTFRHYVNEAHREGVDV